MLLSLRRLLGLSVIVLLVALFFLFNDVRHRMSGYQIAHGHGIIGTATVTGCWSDLFGTGCRADFVSADGKVHRSVVLNGPSDMAHRLSYPAAVGDAGAGEAWTLTGSPWWRPSVGLIAALAPVGLVVASLWSLVAGGPIVWRAQARAFRSVRARERDHAHREEIRRGHVH